MPNDPLTRDAPHGDGAATATATATAAAPAPAAAAAHTALVPSLPEAILSEAAALVRDDLLLFDTAGTPPDPQGREQARLAHRAERPATVILAHALAAAETGEATHIERTLGLAAHLLQRPMRMAILAATAGAIVASPQRARLAGTLPALLAAADRVQIDGYAALKTGCLAQIAAAGLALLRERAVAPDTAVADAIHAGARRALALAARLEDPSLLAACLIDFQAQAALPAAARAGAVISYLNRTLVRLIAGSLSLPQRRHVMDVLGDWEHAWSAAADAASLAAADREAPEVGVRRVTAWHEAHLVAPFLAERAEAEAQLRAQMTAALADPAPEAAARARALAEQARDGRVELSTPLTPAARARGLTSGLPAFDGIELEILRPVIAHFRGVAPAPHAVLTALAELRDWRATGSSSIADGYRAAVHALHAALGRTAPGALLSCLPTLTTIVTTPELREAARRMAAGQASLAAGYDRALEQSLLAHLCPSAGAHAAAVSQYAAAPARMLLAHMLVTLTPRCTPGALAAWRDRLCAASARTGGPAEVAAAWVLAVLMADPPLPPSVGARIFASLGPEGTRLVAELLLRSPCDAKAILARVAAPVRLVLAREGHSASSFADTLIVFAEAAAVATAGAEESSAPAARVTTPEVEPPGASQGALRITADEVASLIRAAHDSPPRPLADLTPVRLGRTLILERSQDRLGVKLRRADESLDALVHEQAQMADKRGRGAASYVPEPYAVLVPGPALPAPVTEALVAAGLAPAADHSCFVYRVEPEGTGVWTYVNAAGSRQRRRGMKRAATDLFAWLRRGEVHPALTTKNHCVALLGARRYEWMIDVCFPPLERRGMGRFDRVQSACDFPNVRATGIADLAELEPLATIIAAAEARRDEDMTTPDPVPSLHNHPPALARMLHEARFVGDYLLDLTLLTADAYRRRGSLRRDRPSFARCLRLLAAELEELWVHCFTEYTGRTRAAAAPCVRAAVDFATVAAQLATFLEPENYVDDFQALLAAPERDGRAAEELAARLKARLYGAELDLQIDLSRSRTQFAARDAEMPDGPLGYCSDHVHHDLGPFNGPWPLLELERALYVVTSLMLVARTPT